MARSGEHDDQHAPTGSAPSADQQRPRTSCAQKPEPSLVEERMERLAQRTPAEPGTSGQRPPGSRPDHPPSPRDRGSGPLARAQRQAHRADRRGNEAEELRVRNTPQSAIRPGAARTLARSPPAPIAGATRPTGCGTASDADGRYRERRRPSRCRRPPGTPSRSRAGGAGSRGGPVDLRSPGSRRDDHRPHPGFSRSGNHRPHAARPPRRVCDSRRITRSSPGSVTETRRYRVTAARPMDAGAARARCWRRFLAA